MTRWLLLVPLAYIAAVADTSLADAFCVGQMAPDFLALAAMLWLLVVAKPGAFLAVGAIGLVSDLIAPGRIGFGLAGFLVAGYLVARLRARLAPEHFLWHAMFTFAAVALVSVVTALGHRLLGEVSLPLTALALRSAGVGLYTAALSVPLFMIVAWIREPFLARQRKLAAA